VPLLTGLALPASAELAGLLVGPLDELHRLVGAAVLANGLGFGLGLGDWLRLGDRGAVGVPSERPRGGSAQAKQGGDGGSWIYGGEDVGALRLVQV